MEIGFVSNSKAVSFALNQLCHRVPLINGGNFISIHGEYTLVATHCDEVASSFLLARTKF